MQGISSSVVDDAGPHQAYGVIENIADPSTLIAISSAPSFESLYLFPNGAQQNTPYVALQPTLLVTPDYTISFLVKPEAAIFLPPATNTSIDVSLGQKFVILGRNLTLGHIANSLPSGSGNSLSVSVGVNGIVLFQSDNNASSFALVPLVVVPYTIREFSLLSFTVSGVGYVEVYINTTLVSTVLLPSAPPNFAPASFGSSNFGNFEGYLAFVSVFDRILAANQIAPFIPFALLPRKLYIFMPSCCFSCCALLLSFSPPPHAHSKYNLC